MSSARLSIRRLSPRLIPFVVWILLLTGQAYANGETNTDKARRIIDFCLANRDKCSLSIHHISGGWERHLSADRLNPLASSWKVAPLIAYGKAVADGRLQPDRRVSRDEWGRFFVGADGNALRNAWTRFGSPSDLTVDQMIDAMMRESDNAAPDWVFAELGQARLDHAISRYLLKDGGFHDIPRLIAGLFVTWDENPEEPLIGERMAADFSDGGTYGYRSEVDRWSHMLMSPVFVSSVQNYRCAFLPWITPPPCIPTTVSTSEPALVRLQQGFYTRSNTRTYTRLMSGLLQRDLLPHDTQAVVEPHIEHVRSSTGNRFARYGGKSGTLGTSDGLTVINWTSYLETNSGTRVALTLHLKGSGGYLPIEFAFNRSSLGEALAEDATFAEETRDRIEAEVPRPDLVGRFHYLDSHRLGSRYFLTAAIDIFNIGVRRANAASSVAFYLSADSVLDPGDVRIGRVSISRLKAGDEDRRYLIATLGTASPSGKFLITIIDPDNTVQESEESGNTQWEKLR